MNDWAVEKPHGPDSQMLPSASMRFSGSPSVRCGSAIVAGANFAFQEEYAGIGWTPLVPCDDPGTTGTGRSVVVNVPVYVYGPPGGRNGPSGALDLQTCTVYVPGSMGW